MPVPLIIGAIALTKTIAGSWLAQQAVSAAVSEGGKKLIEEIAKSQTRK